MLIPPSSPRMSQPAFEKWKVINHAPFDSTCANHFDETSMHLTFTGYDVPVGSTVQHGAQDVEAQYVEAVVKVFNGQKWVADLDIWETKEFWGKPGEDVENLWWHQTGKCVKKA